VLESKMAPFEWSSQEEEAMDLERMMSEARDALTVKRVFGEPVEKDGVTVMPAARVQGGGGGGGGEGPEGQGRGSGGGFGLTARPVGAYVIRGQQVTWQPALDLNRLLVGAQIVALVGLLTIRTIIKARSRRR
jgi:uncharacterized spore protein YtfJ